MNPKDVDNERKIKKVINIWGRCHSKVFVKFIILIKGYYWIAVQ